MKQIDEFTMEDSCGSSRHTILKHSMDSAKRQAELTGDRVKAVAILMSSGDPAVKVLYTIAVYGQTQQEFIEDTVQARLGQALGPNHRKVLASILSNWNNATQELYDTLFVKSTSLTELEQQDKLKRLIESPLIGSVIVDRETLSNTRGKLRCPAVVGQYNQSIESIRCANKQTLDATLQLLGNWQNESDKWSFEQDFIDYCRELYERIIT
jgi:hypothetical protein